ncbi:MoaD/ThiS family protein [Candidatus Vondammii sp. HM_W22]|uniref:MoaD/ThiS family protein n=1 Tax=Candidatus Vondammii sp. HM_W22 TaxID=2687299 RepID=UPI002E7AB085|nr:MoaD/ThiS family protein [Candidatus Vondammii sp. HM_W22]
MGYDRNADTAKPRKVKLLYFTYLVKKLHRKSEEVDLAESVKDVASLLEWVRRRNRDKAHLFKEGSVQVTINKQFSEPFTLLEDGDEIAFIPTSPIAPVAD